MMDGNMNRQINWSHFSSGNPTNDLSSRSNYPNYFNDKNNNVALIDLLKNMCVPVNDNHINTEQKKTTKKR